MRGFAPSLFCGCLLGGLLLSGVLPGFLGHCLKLCRLLFGPLRCGLLSRQLLGSFLLRFFRSRLLQRGLLFGLLGGGLLRR